MNSFESNLLELEGIKKENMQVFYAGYDHNIFYPYFKKEKNLMLFLLVNIIQI